MTEILTSAPFWIAAIPMTLLMAAFGIFLWWWISDKNSSKPVSFRVCVSVLIMLFYAWSAYGFLDNLFIFDRSAHLENEVLIWDETEYLAASGWYDMDDCVAITEEGFRIYQVAGDKKNRFIVLGRNGKYSLYAKKGVSVPVDGAITLVTFDGASYKEKELLKAMDKIYADFKTSYVYTDYEMWKNTDDKNLSNLCINYENCPVGIRTVDYVGKLNGDIVYARRHQSGTDYNSADYHTYDVYVVDDESAKILRKYFE